MSGISSKEHHLLPAIASEEPTGVKDASRPIHRSLALLGLALSVGTAGVLVNQQNAKSLKVTPVANSQQTLADVLAQNTERKYELSRAAIASGDWEMQRGVVRHVVREDETLWQLTQMYQVDAAAIAASNNISASTKLEPGTELLIPPVSGLIHRVKAGDTLDAIARFYGVSEGDIARYSELSSPEFLEIDRPLVIPGSIAMLLSRREEDAKRRLLAERERLQERLQELEGKPVLVNAKASVTVRDIAKKPKFIAYKVQDGDTLETIARRYGVSQQALLDNNELADPHWLELGQELRIPLSRPVVQTVAFAGKPPKVVAPAPQPTAVTDPASPEIVKEVKVAAATPILPLGNAPVSQLDPWDGLLKLTGSDLNRNVPTVPTREEVSPIGRLALATNLPAAVEPTVRLAATLAPFIPEQLVEAKLEEAIALALPATPSNLAPAAISSVEVKRDMGEQVDAIAPAPTGNAVKAPAVEPSPTVKVAAATPLLEPRALEERLDAATAPKTQQTETSRPASEPTGQPIRIALAPALPASVASEQGIAPAAPTQGGTNALPAAEPPIQVAVAPALPLAPLSNVLEEKLAVGAPESTALAPESEARMSSAELDRLEKEIEQLKIEVRQAEIQAAERQAEAAKIAAATLAPSAAPNTERSAIANEAESASPLAPKLPQLQAAAYLPNAPDYGLGSGFVWPAQGVLTSGFGWRWGRIHQGIDIAAPIGTPIYAAASGTVEYAGWNDGGYGNMIDIRHADGTITRYAHLNAVYVRAGQTVSQAQPIAAMGSTGFSTGPHLHFEIRPRGGSAVNPMPFLAQATRVGRG